MFIHRRRPWDPQGGSETPPDLFRARRAWLRRAGYAAGGLGLLGAGGWAGWRWWRGSDEEVVARGRIAPPAVEPTPAGPLYPAPRDERFQYGREETPFAEMARFTNFYEFSRLKSSWRLVDPFTTRPWTITVAGLCRQPFEFEFDEFLRRFRGEAVERQYRHRCVETWAMAVPWTGIPLAAVLRAADPLSAATHVRFVSFDKPEEASGMSDRRFPWPYTEGLTLPEAMHDLTLLATGAYGEPLLKQNGAPLRLVVPWKYGYKSIKSLVRIELVDRQPETFWSTVKAEAYPFESNVEPHVPRPWPQHMERMLGSGTVFRTQVYNGYGEYVAGLYRSGAG